MENFRLSAKFLDVNQECSFVVKNNNIYTNIREHFCKYDMLTNLIEKLLDKRVYWFVLLNNNVLVYQYENGGSLFLLKDNNEINEISGKYYLYSSLVVNNNEILIDKKDIKTKKYETVRVVDDSVIKTNLIYFPDKIINENLYVYIALNTLHIYSLGGSLVWQYGFNTLLNTNKDVTQTGEIISYKDKLFIYLYDNEDKRATIALDVETGNELFRTSEFKGYIRLQEDRIYALYGKSVSILNPETYHIRKIDLSEELAVLDESIEEFLGAESLGYTTLEFNLSPTIYEVHYPYLYFTQERGAQVGVLNLETEKLEWHATMDIDYPVNPVVMDIKACENRLYVHCADKTLHIFEME